MYTNLNMNFSKFIMAGANSGPPKWRQYSPAGSGWLSSHVRCCLYIFVLYIHSLPIDIGKDLVKQGDKFAQNWSQKPYQRHHQVSILFFALLPRVTMHEVLKIESCVNTPENNCVSRPTQRWTIPRWHPNKQC
jgi:hypothetical protein